MPTSGVEERGIYPRPLEITLSAFAEKALSWWLETSCNHYLDNNNSVCFAVFSVFFFFFSGSIP